LDEFLFDGFLEEGLVLAVVFGRGAGLVDDICEVEMQWKMFLEIGSWRCTFKKRESDMQRGGMSRNVTGPEDGSGILMALDRGGETSFFTVTPILLNVRRQDQRFCTEKSATLV
jgi:hypothetical protein